MRNTLHIVPSYLFYSWPFCFFFHHTPTTEIYTLSLHDALPILGAANGANVGAIWARRRARSSGERRSRPSAARSEEHTSELQSLRHLVCRLLLEKKKVSINS